MMAPSSFQHGGPLAGLKIVEFSGIGPGPFAAMLLADLGADIVRIDRAQDAGKSPGIMSRGRRSIALDLKKQGDVETVLSLLDRADALIEGFRPGVMERLGIGPDVVLKRNPRLAYCRMTGWGQTGPMATVAGHDINYIALSGLLHAVGTEDQPVPPLNIAGDFGGGSLYLMVGLLAAVMSARQTGRGQVVDCAMVDGSASLLGLFYELHNGGQWGPRGSNLLDGAAPFYQPYRCADGKWISLGSIEPQFYAILLDKIGWTAAEIGEQNDRQTWPEMKTRFAALFATRSRDEWCALMEGTDICFAPILDFAEATRHPHNVARGTFVELEGHLLPGPSPRFSLTPGRLGRPVKALGQDATAVAADWGVKMPRPD